MRALIFCILVLPLIACAAPPKTETSQTLAPASSAAPSTRPASPPVVDIASAITGPAAESSEPSVVDASCKTDADCAVKNVGSCCGYYPRCLNKDSPTFPEQVKARCAKQGRMGVCGFPAISACHCDQGKCTAIGGGVPVH